MRLVPAQAGQCSWPHHAVLRWFPGAYEWAQKTLKDHAKDKRPYVYTRRQLEEAQTHDQLWNAAQVLRSRARRGPGTPSKSCWDIQLMRLTALFSIRWSLRGRCTGS